LVNVKKKDGRTEEFKRTKIERSLKNVGVKETNAKEIANKVSEKEGMTTTEIRESVQKELRNRNKEAAEKYESSRRLAARKAIDAAKGTVRLTEETMKRLNLRPGENLELCHKDNRITLKAEKGLVATNEIRLHEDDLRKIGAPEGTRIVARRKR
jgi:phosphatidate phosphatase PAH1